MAEPRCFFLEIPVELRLQIYAEAMHPPRHLHLASFGASDLAGMDEDEVATTCFFQVVWYKHDETGADPSILRTCKKIHHEAQPLLCNPSVVWLSPACGPSASTTQLFDIRKLRTIKRLKNLRIILCTHPCTKKQNKQHSEYMTRFINPAMLVECLTIGNPLRDDVGEIMDMASDWFKAVEKVDMTALCIHTWSSWCAGRDGVWKDWTAAQDILYDFDRASHRKLLAAPALLTRSTDVSVEVKLRLAEYFEMVKKTHKAAKTSHGLNANTTIDNALQDIEGESHDGGD